MRLRGKQLRTEQKYYIHMHDYLALRMKLSQLMTLDPNSVDVDGYNIRSLYFDDPRKTALETKNDGIFSRQKFRIRIYNGSDNHIALERKSKLGEYVAKESIRISREQYDQILHGNYESLYADGDPLAHDFYAAMTAGGYRPTVIVDYWREAFIYPHGNVRITFDKRLAVAANQQDLFHPELLFSEISMPGVTIMEVKFDDVLPNVVRELITPAYHLRSTISKYVLCREKLMLLHTQ
ncbi:polyphosphate polymerase domain-containing protein [Cohnella sp.]|uniref:polyphosphate polymerase domain-containing protein n=1 Tax=Cohnella sp. TaxID=1883426 RepID=UPI00356584DA